MLSSDTTLFVVVLLTTVAAVALGALSENRGVFDQDEGIYVRVIRLFNQGVSLDLLRTYEGEPASPGPLFFVVYSAVGRILSPSYSVYRGLSLVITLLAAIAAWAHIRMQAPRAERSFFPLLLFLFPYIFCMGFAVMAEPLTLLLTVLGMLWFLQGLAGKSNWTFLLGSLALTAALHVRIHAIFAPAALMLVLLLQRDFAVGRWLAALAPIVLRLPLVFLQGGLTVSREAFPGAKPELGLCLSHINFFFVWFGYAFFPLLWWCRERRGLNLAGVLCLLPFYVWATPRFLESAHYGAIRTILLSFDVTAEAAPWLLLPGWLVGCYISIDLLQRVVLGRSPREQFLSASILLFMLSLVFSTVAFERYYQLAVPAIVFLGLPKTRRISGYLMLAVWHFVFLALAAFRLGKDLL